MPFTISHAAAVLPLQRLTRHGIPLAALMIGSMSPDFSYFLPGDLETMPTHTLPGLFWFCLPAGFFVWLLFVQLLEAPAFALLPQAWRERLPRSNQAFAFKTLALAAFAILIGAVTHIAWDSFTHRSPVTDALPALRTIVFETASDRVRLYRVLQHASSLVGLSVLLIWAWRIRGREPLPSSLGSDFNLQGRERVTAIVFILATSAAFALVNYCRYENIPIERQLYHVAIGSMLGGMLSLSAVALGLRLWRGSKSR